MNNLEHSLVCHEVQRWSLKLRCLLLVLILLIMAVGIFGAVTTIMDDSTVFAAGLAIAFCGILMPPSVGLLIWTNRLETELKQQLIKTKQEHLLFQRLRNRCFFLLFLIFFVIRSH